MAKLSADITSRYDTAAPRWRDKMRALGYYDGYLGFLNAFKPEPNPAIRIIDIGAGTGSFAEAWVAIHGSPGNITLLDPSAAMLERGQSALRARHVEPDLLQSLLDEVDLEPVDVALAAHVIEHCENPLAALKQIHDLLRPGGRLYLVVSKPHWCNAIIWFQWRHRTFRDDEITAMLQTSGFKPERLYPFPSGPPSRTSRGIVAVRKD